MRGQEALGETEPGERQLEPVALLRVANAEGELLYANPASSDGTHTFVYVDPIDQQEKPMSLQRAGNRVQLSCPALSTASTVT